MINAESIIEYWYSDKVKSQWFNASAELDQEIKTKFEDVWLQAIKGEYKEWGDSAVGSLALTIILDQFPLNMFRGSVKSFSTEGMAIKVSKNAIKNCLDLALGKERLTFLYMPLMHSENIDDQNMAVELFEKAGLPDNLRFAKHHRDIIKRFGRFPHRNEILQRTSSDQEIEYLNSDGAFKG